MCLDLTAENNMLTNFLCAAENITFQFYIIRIQTVKLSTFRVLHWSLKRPWQKIFWLTFSSSTLLYQGPELGTRDNQKIVTFCISAFFGIAECHFDSERLVFVVICVHGSPSTVYVVAYCNLKRNVEGTTQVYASD